MNKTASSGPKCPAVWLNLDQRELDDAYDQSKLAPNRYQVVGRWCSNSSRLPRRSG